MYAHIAQNNVPPYNVDFDQWHSLVESLVQNRTDKFYDRKVFFKYENVIINTKEAYDVTLEVEWDTYKGPNPSELVVRDAFWLHSNFFLNWSFTLEEGLIEVNQTKAYYYNRIEENLNKAIEGCITTMNVIEIYQESEMTRDETIGIDLNILLLLNITLGSLITFYIRKKKSSILLLVKN